MSSLSSLPPELLYTILSHALADILFDYLFIGALFLDEVPVGLEEISSLGGVSVAWRATLHRILAAATLLHHHPSLLPTGTNHHHHQIRQVQHRAHQLTTRTMTTARAHPSPVSIVNTPISISAASASTINATHHVTTTTTTTTIPSLLPHQRTLHTMQIALRDLVQHSIDTYRNEQDQDVTMGGQANQTGVTTPTLLPPPMPVQTVLPPVQVMSAQNPTGGTPNPLVPHSIQPHPPPSIPPTHPPASLSNPAPTQPNLSPPPPAQNNHNHHHHLGALVLLAAPTLQPYATTTNPLFQAALWYSQAAVFTCPYSSSSAFCSPTRAQQQPTGRWNLYEGIVTHDTITATASRGAIGGRVQRRRPDLSTLVLTTPRLIAALEWVGGHDRISPREPRARICPRELCEVVECGMGEVRERIEEAIQVCRWNDLLHAVFLRGERSEETLEALDGCFDDLEANAGSIQMHHLLRSNLFKTVQTIARLGPISLGPHWSSSSNTGAAAANTPPQLHPTPPPHSGEIWRSRAGALAFRWMGRVVEWTGL